jgi:hypothetical protein
MITSHAIDAVMTALGHRLGECYGNAFPNTGGTPSSEPPIDGIPVAILLRNVAPRCSGAETPKDAIDDVPAAFGRSPTAALSSLTLNRQQNPQNTPLDLRQIAAAQGCLPESAAFNQNRIHASMNLFTPARVPTAE